MNRPVEGRLLALLADSVTEGLRSVEAAELRRALPCGGGVGLEFERAAAAIDLALAPPDAETLPRVLRDRILMSAGRYVNPVDRRDRPGPCK